MQRLADQVIVLSRNGGGVTNLELQKIMYFAVGDYIAEHGIDDFIINLYSEPFEAWPYGPVVRSVYFRYKIQGRSKITASTDYHTNLSVIDRYIEKYFGIPVQDLVERSHGHEIWKNNVYKIMEHYTITYTLDDIKDAFVNS